MGAAALPIVMVAASTAASMASQSRQTSAVKQQTKAQEMQNTLQLATQERSSQDVLQKALARQSVRNAATGVDSTSGSALSVANAAKAQTDRDLSLLYAGTNLAELRGSLAAGNSGASNTDSLLNLGLTAGKVLMSSNWK